MNEDFGTNGRLRGGFVGIEIRVGASVFWILGEVVGSSCVENLYGALVSLKAMPFEADQSPSESFQLGFRT